MSYMPKTVGFQAGERNVFLHVLTACNLSCNHCYINQQQHGANMLPRDQLEKWVRLFSRKDNKQSNIIFLGGEPTMHPDLVHGIRVARKCGYHVTVDTNGYLFHEFLERVSPGMLDYLSFSLDGPDGAINDAIRGEGVFEVCTTNLRKAVELGFNVSLIYTVSNRNIDHLSRMVPLLNDLGVKRFFVQVIGMRGKSASAVQQSSGKSSLQVDPVHWLSVVPDVAAKAAACGITTIYPKVYLENNEVFECAGNVAENFFIFPNGRVYLCPLCEDYPIHSYEIKDDQLVEVEGLTEKQLFKLEITEGCVMNKLLQPDTIAYLPDGSPMHRISCCLLKQHVG